MAAVLGLPLQPDDEVLGDLPEHEKATDPLRYAKILKTCSLPGGGFREFAGEVVEIEVGSATGDRLYRIRYSDGDLQHFTAEEVRACMPPGREEGAAPAAVDTPQQALAASRAAAARPGLAVAPVAEDGMASAGRRPPAMMEMPVAAEEADTTLVMEEADIAAVMEDQEVAVTMEGEQEEAGLVAAEQEEELGEALLAEDTEAGELVGIEGEQEVGGFVVAAGEEEVAEDIGLEELAAAAEEDLNLIVLEEEEEFAQEAFVEEAAGVAEKVEDAEAAESELLAGYLGGDDAYAEIEEPEQPAPAPERVLHGLGVQRDIAKVKGRAKMKAVAKGRGRPAMAEEMEMAMEAFDEEAT